MKFKAFCKTECGVGRKSLRYEADSFENLRIILVREFFDNPCPVRFIVCNELYEDVYSGVIIDGTFYFTLYNYKRL